MYKNLIALISLLVVGLAHGTASAALKPMNEVLDEHGQVRATYRVWEQLSRKSTWDVNSIAAGKLSTFPLGDKVKVYPTPLMFSGKHYDAVVPRGTAQRALGFRHLFYDIFCGEQKVFESPQFKNKITPELVENALKAAHTFATIEALRKYYRGKQLTDIGFIYAPDLMRGPKRDWQATEDNIGNLGGLVDSYHIEQAFAAAHGLSPSIFESEPFFTTVLGRYLADENIDPHKALALFDKRWLSADEHTPKRLDDKDLTHAAIDFHNSWFTKADNEFNRLANLVRQLKIPIVNAEDSAGGDQAWLSRVARGEVPFIFERVEPNEWPNFLKYRLFVSANPEMRVFPSPGTQMLSDKVFLPYIEDLIRFYLHEEPILKTAQSTLLNSTAKLIRMADHVRDAVQTGKELDLVLKQPTGSQGSQVYVLRHLTRDQLLDVAEIVERRAHLMEVVGPEYMGKPLLVQTSLPGSMIPVSPDSWLNLNVEIRPITMVIGKHIEVRRNPWGRGAFGLGHSLNNVSQGAFELVTIRDSDCAAVLQAQNAM